MRQVLNERNSSVHQEMMVVLPGSARIAGGKLYTTRIDPHHLYALIRAFPCNSVAESLALLQRRDKSRCIDGDLISDLTVPNVFGVVTDPTMSQ